MKLSLFFLPLLFASACQDQTTRQEGITVEGASLYVASIKSWEARLPFMDKNPSLIGGGAVLNDELIIAANSVRENYDILIGRELEWKRLSQSVVETSRSKSSVEFTIIYELDGASSHRTLRWFSGHFRLD